MKASYSFQIEIDCLILNFSDAELIKVLRDLDFCNISIRRYDNQIRGITLGVYRFEFGSLQEAIDSRLETLKELIPSAAFHVVL